MQHNPSARLAVLAMLLAIVFGSSAALGQQSTVSVRSSPRIQQAGPVTLGEIADLTGPEALRLKALVIVEDFAKEAGADGSLRIEFARIRTAIESHPEVNMGRLLLSGGTTTVRLGPAPAAPNAPPQPAGATSRATPRPAPPTALQQRVSERVAQALGVDPMDVRLEFPKSDASILATPLTGRTATITPGGSGSQMPINVRIFEGDRIVASGTLRPTVEVRRDVLVALSELNRGDGIDIATAARESRWISAAENPADPVTSTGMTVRTRIATGSVIPARSLESPVVVAKGDLISVDVVSGTFAVRAQARAMGPGRVGDVIEFRTQGATRTFRARIDAPGRAVMVAQSSEAESRESGRAPGGARPPERAAPPASEGN